MEFKCANITGYNFAITENILVQTMKFHLYDMLVPRTIRTLLRTKLANSTHRFYRDFVSSRQKGLKFLIILTKKNQKSTN